MSSTLHAEPTGPELNSPELQRRVNSLRTTDNVTNWFYLAREWLFLALVIGSAIGFYQYQLAAGLAWWWNVPVSFLAIVLIGAGQHRLTNLAHEASHYMLFRHRLLNELASDWFAMFPLLSSTHHYRLQHLAHHQYVNDPDKDPDVAQMTASGHKFDFPMPPGQFLWECVIKQFLWLPNLVRYIRVRAKFNSTGGGQNPYQARGKQSPLLVIVALLYLATLIASLWLLEVHGDPLLLALVPAGLWAAIITFYSLAPDRLFLHSLVKCDLPRRWATRLRVTQLTLVFTAMAWLSYLTDRPWGLYYLVLWIVPLFTTFSFFMILRQVVQHGNADSGRLTNTRVFHVHRLIQLAVFPLGMDWHLPHHLFPMVPHYRLRELQDLLMEVPSYRDEAVIVEGYFLHRTTAAEHPTVLELMARGQDSGIRGQESEIKGQESGIRSQGSVFRSPWPSA